jgi:hypothetical protein
MTNPPPSKSHVRKWLLGAAIAALGVAALGMAWYDYRFPSWSEEVLLPDGRKVTVAQRRDFIEGRGTRKTWLTFSLPEMGGEKTWAEWLYPTMIGSIDGKVYVIARPRGGKQFSMYSYPRYGYVAFEWRAGHFERVPFMSVPEALRLTENVRWCLPGGSDSKVSVPGAGNWCVERHTGEDKFPSPKTVDLSIRSSEAKFWAQLDGHVPTSE